MNFDIIAVRQSEIGDIGTASTPCPYNDRLTIIIENALSWHGDCRTWPNMYRPKDSASYLDVYGVIGACQCACSVVLHKKYGKCVLLANGGELPALLPNSNHSGRRVVSEMFIHSGHSQTWPGSAGCITVPPDDYGEMINVLSINDSGTFSLQDRRPHYGNMGIS